MSKMRFFQDFSTFSEVLRRLGSLYGPRKSPKMVIMIFYHFGKIPDILKWPFLSKKCIFFGKIEFFDRPNSIISKVGHDMVPVRPLR